MVEASTFDPPLRTSVDILHLHSGGNMAKVGVGINYRLPDIMEYGE